MVCEIHSEIEIWQTIKELNPIKASRLNEMTGVFYDFYCPIDKDNVVLFIHNFFRGGRMLRGINHTNIALIPKIDSPF